MQWLRRAAEQGYARAQCRLGAVLEVRGETAEAAEWYRKGATQGLADGAFGLGGCYARGLGVKKDLPEAYKWLVFAAARGRPDSTNVLKIIDGMMTHEERLEGRWRARLALGLPADFGENSSEPVGPANGNQPIRPE
jgi:hypothetical protein